MLLSVPIQFGLPKYILRKVSGFSAMNNKVEIRDLIVFSYKIMLTTSLVLFLLSSIFFIYSNLSFKTLVGLLLIALMNSLGVFHGNVLRGVGAVLNGNISELVLKPAFVILLVIVSSYFFNTLSLKIVLIIHFLALIFSLSATLALSKRYMILPKISGVAGLKSLIKVNDPIFRNSLLPLLIVSLVDILNSNTDILILGEYTSKEQIGIYKVALTMSWLFSLPRSIFTLALAPRIAKLFVTNINDFKTEVYRMSQRVFLFSAIVFIIVLSTCHQLIPVIYGIDYSESVIILFLLAIGHIANVSFGMGDVVLNMTGHEKSVAKYSLIAVIVNVIMAFYLVPVYGVKGAAISTSLSLLIWNVTMFLIIKIKLRFYPTPFRFK